VAVTPVVVVAVIPAAVVATPAAVVATPVPVGAVAFPVAVAVTAVAVAASAEAAMVDLVAEVTAVGATSPLAWPACLTVDTRSSPDV
jgi:hypothetical protein